MVPSKGPCSIAIRHVDLKVAQLRSIVEDIPPEVSADKEPVFRTDLVVELCIEIEEVVVQPAKHFIAHKGADDIHDVSAPAGDHKARPIAYKGAFDGQTRRDQPNTAVGAIIALVALFHADVEYRREASAVSGRPTSLVQAHFLNGIGVEDGKKSQHVPRVVHDGFIQAYEVLVGTATTHIQSRRAFVCRTYTGQQLQCLEHICLTHELRNRLDGLYGKVYHIHLRLAKRIRLVFTVYDYFL